MAQSRLWRDFKRNADEPPPIAPSAVVESADERLSAEPAGKVRGEGRREAARERAFKLLGWLAAAAAAGGGAAVGMAKFPETFGWLERVLGFMR
jgi:hypothetical protein